MVLGKLPVPGGPTNLNCSMARAYCACSRCGWGLFGHFFSHLSFLSPSLWETAQCRLKYCLKGLLRLNQPTKTISYPQQPKNTLTLLHSERPKLYTILAFLSAIGLTVKYQINPLRTKGLLNNNRNAKMFGMKFFILISLQASNMGSRQNYLAASLIQDFLGYKTLFFSQNNL